MTAYINKLKDKTGNQQLPVTHERAVRDDNGTTLESKMQNLEGAMDKAYVAQSDNGMGRITLKKNMVSDVNTLTQSMMQATNTIYVIRYDFTLGEDITVPANCILEFDGGSIVSGNLNCNGNLVIFNGYNGDNVYNIKPGTPTKKIKIYDSLYGNDVGLDQEGTRIKQGQKRGYNGYIFCPDFTLGTPIEDTISSMIETAVYAKSIGFECHALKPHAGSINSIETLTNAISIIRQAATALHNAIGDVEYLVMFGETPYILETTDATIISTINSFITELHTLGYNKVIMQPDTERILTEIYTDSIFNVDVVGGDIYTPVSGTFGAITKEDVIKSFQHDIELIKEVKIKTNKPYIVSELGIGPFEECFYRPGGCNFWSYTRNNEVPYIYWNGVLNSELAEIADEIWTWFDTYFNEDVYKLFRSVTGIK